MKLTSPIRALIVGALVSSVAACGASDSGSAQPDATSGVDTSVDLSTPAVDRPERIVVLSPTHTEIIFALGGGDQVVAVDDQSNYPPEVQSLVTDLSGFEPNVESIVSYEPDLVVIGDDYNGLAAQLQSVGIESWVSPAPQSVEEVLVQIEDLGARIGRSDEASQLVETMRTQIDDIVAATGRSEVPLTYYHELDDSYFTVTSNTFIGSVYDLFGLRNIADAAEADSDYPQLSAEFILDRNPDLIFLADTKCCAMSPDVVAARPGWGVLKAVTMGHVVSLDDDVASRWGPRVVDFVRSIAEAISAVLVPSN